MELITEVHEQSLVQMAGEQLFKILKNLAQSQDRIMIALSGGSSLNDLYKFIRVNASLLDINVWSKIYFCFADERLVPLTDSESNYFQISQTFLDELVRKKYITQNQILKVPIGHSLAHVEYSHRVGKVDIALLGVGEDGHTASLFPNHASILSDEHGYILVKNSPKLPKERITLSKNALLAIPYLFMFFIGEKKMEAFKNFQNTKVSVLDCPCKLIQEHDQALVYSNIWG